MRLGRYHADESEALMPILNRFDLQDIIIHPRTGVQMYTGGPDLKAFEKCLAMTDHTIIYNGDIVDRSSFILLQDRFPGISEWMIGRGAIVNPFLPGLIKGKRYDRDAAFRRLKMFHDTLYDKYSQKLFGPSHLVNRMKGIWGYFAKAFRNGQILRKKINKTQKKRHYEAVVNDFFEADPQWQDGILDDRQGARIIE
jgi:tRNA-dihydrouridine synthase